MNPASPLQLQMPATRNGVLSVVFQDKSDPEEIPSFEQAIEKRFSSDKEIRQVIFDLSRIDPLLNAAGRLVDLACAIHKRWKRPVAVKIPTEIYKTLHEIEGPRRVPSPNSKPPLRLRGLTELTAEVVASLPASFGEDDSESVFEPSPVAETKTILCCRGKVRSVNGTLVTVSLFTGKEIIDGEFERSQFSRQDFKAGDIFEYQARINSPGVTTVLIDLLTNQYATDEELMEASDELPVDFSLF